MKSPTEHLPKKRQAALEITPQDFRALGHMLVDEIADFMAGLNKRPVSPGKSVPEIQSLLQDIQLGEAGEDPEAILRQTMDLLFNNSTFNGHPRFLGYITSSAAPIGILGELLAASVNANVGGWQLSPIASEIERQCIQWISTMVGYNDDAGGVLCSGGNMANFQAFLAAKTIKLGIDVRQKGLHDYPNTTIYVSRETHTWVQKAADLFGVGTNQIRWIETDPDMRMSISGLEAAIKSDLNKGYRPFMVVGTAGTVSTGVVDNLDAIADLCATHDLWFHVDGAYGAFACITPDHAHLFKGINRADSIALDPHKWLYSPLEAGCTLIKNADHLPATFSYRPDYYNFDDETNREINYYEQGIQNSRGFRALKVWLSLRQAGLSGYREMISEDCRLASQLYKITDNHPELQAKSCNLSITTFRFIPVNRELNEEQLNELNEKILTVMKREGQLFVSNAVIDGTFYLRSCIVNFRTSALDIHRIPAIVCGIGRRLIG